MEVGPKQEKRYTCNTSSVMGKTGKGGMAWLPRWSVNTDGICRSSSTIFAWADAACIPTMKTGS